jgi:acyl-CoA thioesterase I
MKAALGAAVIAIGLAAPALAEPVRVVTFGTSLTQAGGWQQPLAQRLAAATGCDVRVFKVAKAGETSAWGLSQIDRVLALRPDVVVVEFAINDAHLRQRTSVAQSTARMGAILDRLKQAPSAPAVSVVLTNPVWGAGQWLRRPRLDAYFDAHARLAARAGAGIIDLRLAWRAYVGTNWRAALPDGLHPEPAAAQAVLPAGLAPALADEARSRCMRRGGAGLARPSETRAR